MSVKVHEAFCFDSFMDRLLFFDDFHGDQLQDEWNSAGAGFAVVVDQQTGGIVRITTGAVSGQAHRIDWGNVRSLLVSKKVTMEFRLKLNQTTQTIPLLEIRFDADNRILFFTLQGEPNWRIQTENGGAVTNESSGIAKDTDYHVFRIECLPTGEVHFYIDGVETSNSPITTNIPTDYLQPFFQISNGENVAKSMDIDYVYIRQERT